MGAFRIACGTLRDMTKPDGTQKRLYSLPEAQAYLNLGRSTLYRHIEEGLPIVKLGRRIMFDRADLDAYIDANKTTVTDARPCPTCNGTLPAGATCADCGLYDPAAS